MLDQVRFAYHVIARFDELAAARLRVRHNSTKVVLALTSVLVLGAAVHIAIYPEVPRNQTLNGERKSSLATYFSNPVGVAILSNRDDEVFGAQKRGTAQ